jgi:hypothetical protein
MRLSTSVETGDERALHAPGAFAKVEIDVRQHHEQKGAWVLMRRRHQRRDHNAQNERHSLKLRCSERCHADLPLNSGGREAAGRPGARRREFRGPSWPSPTDRATRADRSCDVGRLERCRASRWRLRLEVKERLVGTSNYADAVRSGSTEVTDDEGRPPVHDAARPHARIQFGIAIGSAAVTSRSRVSGGGKFDSCVECAPEGGQGSVNHHMIFGRRSRSGLEDSHRGPTG